MAPLFRHRLARELIVVLVVKIAALALLWFAFFRGGHHVEPARLVAPAATAQPEAHR